MADGRRFLLIRLTELVFTSHIDKSLRCRCTMESMQQAAILFWIPLILIGIGSWLSINKKTKILGLSVVVISSIIFLISPWTVPTSDSTAGAHLILSIIAPTILLLYGLHGVIFGGNVPVGRLDSSARWSGFFAMFVAITIFCLMHWTNFTPVWRGEVNPYWIVFWPTMLLFSTSLCATASIGMVGYGEDRFNESVKLAGMSILFAAIIYIAMLVDGELITAGEFRDYLFLAVADIFGIVMGGLLAIGIFALVIWSYEKSLPTPVNTHPPTEHEIKKVVEIAKSHIGGEEE